VGASEGSQLSTGGPELPRLGGSGLRTAEQKRAGLSEAGEVRGNDFA
jgi:hypothetical protein